RFSRDWSSDVCSSDLPQKLDVGQEWVYFLPHLNAVINTGASVALILGLVFIKNNHIKYHRTAMTTAFSLGFIFMISYVIYHASEIGSALCRVGGYGCE